MHAKRIIDPVSGKPLTLAQKAFLDRARASPTHTAVAVCLADRKCASDLQKLGFLTPGPSGLSGGLAAAYKLKPKAYGA